MEFVGGMVTVVVLLIMAKAAGFVSFGKKDKEPEGSGSGGGGGVRPKPPMDQL